MEPYEIPNLGGENTLSVHFLMRGLPKILLKSAAIFLDAPACQQFWMPTNPTGRVGLSRYWFAVRRGG
jgi:hypothetical protein